MKLSQNEFFSKLERGEIRWFSYGGASYYSSNKKYEELENLVDTAYLLCKDMEVYAGANGKMTLTKERIRGILNSTYLSSHSRDIVNNMKKTINKKASDLQSNIKKLQQKLNQLK